MNNLVMLLIACGAIGALIGFLTGAGIFLYRGGRGWRNIGKAPILTLPEGPGRSYTWEYHDVKDGAIVKKEGRQYRAILPDGTVSYPGPLGQLHILTSYGHSLKAPGKQEYASFLEKQAIGDWVLTNDELPEAGTEGWEKTMRGVLAKAKDLVLNFLIADPWTYYKAIDENDMEDLRNSTGAGKDPWYAGILVIGVIACLLLLLGVFGAVVFKVLPLLKAAKGG